MSVNSYLNCAEAVNFVPADLLPHGGIGPVLYFMYCREPILSHEIFCMWLLRLENTYYFEALSCEENICGNINLDYI